MFLLLFWVWILNKCIIIWYLLSFCFCEQRVSYNIYKSINMSRQTLAHIKFLSNVLPDPYRAERAMFKCIMCSLRLCKRVLTRDLLYNLMKCGLGTNDVENCVKYLCNPYKISFKNLWKKLYVCGVHHFSPWLRSDPNRF